MGKGWDWEQGGRHEVHSQLEWVLVEWVLVEWVLVEWEVIGQVPVQMETVQGQVVEMAWVCRIDLEAD